MMGRPKKGPMSSYPPEIADQIKSIRQAHPGWGAVSIAIELVEAYGYSKSALPSLATIDRYLKSKGLVAPKAAKREFPNSKKCLKKSRKVHQCWEMDAKSALSFSTIGYQALINIKDVKSRVHCMAFPVSVRHQKSQPRTVHYYWALRLAFMEFGRPEVLQVDKDSVFRENTTPSPFPTKLHLWLLGLGVELCFIKQPPPYKNAMVERSHQTMEKQIRVAKGYDCWKQLFQACQQRRRVLNEKMPNRSLGKKAPLQVYPQARQSKRPYCLEAEEDLIDLKRIYRYLAKCSWYRRVTRTKTISLGGQIYYVKGATPYTQLQITFCNRAKKLVFRDVNELIIAKIPLKKLSVKDVIGGSKKQLQSRKSKIFNRRNCPL